MKTVEAPQGIPAAPIADVKVITQNNKQLTAKADAVQEANECDIQELSTVTPFALSQPVLGIF